LFGAQRFVVAVFSIGRFYAIAGTCFSATLWFRWGDILILINFISPKLVETKKNNRTDNDSVGRYSGPHISKSVVIGWCL